MNDEKRESKDVEYNAETEQSQGQGQVFDIKKNQIKVGDKVLTLKHPGTRWYYQHRDNCTLPGGTLSRVDYIQGFLDYVVLHPKLSLEDFGIEELGEFLRQVESFLRRNP